MTHEYQISGITCEGCVSKIKARIDKIPGVTDVAIGLDGKAQISMSRHLTTAELNASIQDYPKYRIVESSLPPAPKLPDDAPKQSFWQTYKPILLVFAYILGTTLLVEAVSGSLDWMRWMRHFMAGFFLVFSFFKMLDVPAFAMAYSSYDVVARRWLGWGYIYPFVELALGILFLSDANALITNGLTLVIMSVSTIGVILSLLAKRRFQCACLGAVFNLPMSNVTLFEDVLMVLMSGTMLVLN